jgi:ligand-binding SRPBCC domain-containing protein
MTVLENSIRIDAPPEKVWAALASLEMLDRYDPGVVKAEIVSETREGPGSARQCDLTPGGWFKEKVSEWRPHEALAFELYECTLPVRRLKHSYRLVPDGSGTLVQQRMEYQLKFGPLGKLLDAVVVKRKWIAGIKGFFSGLKRYVEAGEGRSSGRL